MRKFENVKIKRALTIFTLFALFTLLSSHEFWLSPDKFIYQRTEKTTIRFLVGENFEGENWKGNNEKIQSLKLYYGGVSDDLTKYIGNQEGDSLEMMILDEGINVVAYNSKNSFIQLEGKKFNDYLQEDGISDALEFRRENNELDGIGREQYQRCAKTIFQVGKITDKTFSVNTNLPLEIIPLSNPYLVKKNDSLAAKIIFQNNPLANYVIKIWHRDNDSTIQIEMLTNENGEIKFPVSPSGKWMISLVKMERLIKNDKADWQSYWGSLTWGYQ